ncbi:MAG: NAD-dependent protein deacetylase [Tenericutes bacterium ADurb.Bin239]|nr:MAG: NAD-dependent protein deacetylase [Tenericutes bacterium ADurb.Bin239]
MEQLTAKVLAFKKIIDQSKNIVFFGGAGVSVPSGIPDFRSADGVYFAPTNTIYSAEEMVSRTMFYRNTALFNDFYFKHLVYPDAKPNPCHLYLAKLEEKGVLTAVVTQNIDGLHQIAGNKVVYELHGSVHRNYCTKCHTFHNLEQTLKEPQGKCKHCGNYLKPDVVLFEEGLDGLTLSRSVTAISKADTLIIGGTSLIVQPAASLIHYFQGKNIVVVNKTSIRVPTFLAPNLLFIEADIGKTFELLSQLDNN